MGDLRDELKKLFPNAGSVKVRKKKKVPSNVLNRILKGRSSSNPESAWKAGVEPLRHTTDRKESRSRHRSSSNAGSPYPHAKNRTRLQSPQPQASSSNPGPARPEKGMSAASPDSPAGKIPKTQPTPLESAKFQLLAESSLAREGDFKQPESWVAAGKRVQPPGSSAGRVLTVRLGIDFGTAYTKLALRAADTVFVIPFDGLSMSSEQYVLPGELSQMPSGDIWPGRAPQACHIYNNLKQPFLTIDLPDAKTLAWTAVFLAWVMQYARAWLFHAQPNLVRDRRLAWEVNIGMPAQSWAATALQGTYRHLGLCAWLLSQSEQITDRAALSLLECASPEAEEIGLDGLQAVAEFAAQVTAYVRSPQRREGLHLLVDVGAGTVDIASFNVYKTRDNELDRFPIWKTEVRPLGTHYLMATRVQKLALSHTGWNDLQTIPDTHAFAQAAVVDEARVSGIDKEFGNSVGEALASVLRYTRENRTPTAEEWHAGLPVFLTGGGASCPVYEQAVEKTCKDMHVDCIKTALPISSDLQTVIEPSVYHRLSVAYGLTHDAELIGDVVPEQEIENFKLTDRPRHDRPDRDELYPDR